MSATARNPVALQKDALLANASNEPINSTLMGSEVAPPPQGGIAGAKAKLNKLDITRRDILKFEVVNGEVLISTKAGCKVLVKGRDIDKKNVFAIAGRGTSAHLVVNTPSGKLADTPITITDLAANVCPVGAILIKEQGYQAPIGKRIFDQNTIKEIALKEHIAKQKTDEDS